MTRARNHHSARSAGTRFERLIADYLARLVDDRIDRRPKTGTKDRGDLGGLRTLGGLGGRVVAECKNTSRLQLAQWATEAETERGHDDAIAGVVIHKRHGVTDPGQQWVTCTVDDFAALLLGQRPQDAEAEA